jgi:hypothetical protein
MSDVTLKIVDWRLDDLKDICKKISKYSPNPIISVVHEEMEPVYFEGNGFIPSFYKKVLTVKVSLSIDMFKTPKAENLSYLGSAKLKDGVPELFPADDSANLRSIDFKGLSCEHCHTARARTNYYFFRNMVTGKLVTIGSTCIGEYFGLDFAKMLNAINNAVRSFTDIENLDWDEIPTGCGGREYYSLESYFIATMLATNNFKDVWVSRDNAVEGFGTSSKVKDILYDRNSKEKYEAYAEFSKSGGFTTEFLAGLEKFKEEADRSDFLFNVKNALFDENGKLDHSPKNPAVVPWAIWKAMEYVRDTGSNETYEKSEYIGDVGAKVEIPVTCIGVHYIDGMYGSVGIFTFVDNNGNVVKSFVSGSFSADVGEKLTIRGTVKDQSEYKGRKETNLTRIKKTA